MKYLIKRRRRQRSQHGDDDSSKLMDEFEIELLSKKALSSLCIYGRAGYEHACIRLPPRICLRGSAPHVCLSEPFRICGHVERSTTTCVSICTSVPVKQVLLYLCRACRTSEHVDGAEHLTLTRALTTLESLCC